MGRPGAHAGPVHRGGGAALRLPTARSRKRFGGLGVVFRRASWSDRANWAMGPLTSARAARWLRQWALTARSRWRSSTRPSGPATAPGLLHGSRPVENRPVLRGGLRAEGWETERAPSGVCRVHGRLSAAREIARYPGIGRCGQELWGRGVAASGDHTHAQLLK